MSPLLLIALLAAAPAQPVKLAATGLKYVGLPAEQGEFFSDHLAQQLGTHGIRVTTPSELSSVLGLERQRQLIGCSSEAQTSACLAELAGALGVDGIVTGSIALLDGRYTANLKIVSAQDARLLAQASGTASGSSALLELLTQQARTLSAATKRALGRDSSSPPPGPGLLRPPVLASAAVGLLGVAAGAFAFSRASGIEQGIRGGSYLVPGDPMRTRTQVDAAVQQGEAWNLGAWGGGAIAVVGLGLATALALAPEGPQVALILGPAGGVTAQLGGSF